MSPPALDELQVILSRYPIAPAGEWLPLPGGNINRSWKILAEVPGSPGSRASYLVQRLNPAVFPDGGAVMRNIARVSSYLEHAVRRLGLSPERRVLRIVRATGGAPAVQGSDGAWWRVLHFIEGTRTGDPAEDGRTVFEVARSFGQFHRLLADFPAPPLEESLPGFHDARGRLDALERAVVADRVGRAVAVAAELEFARERGSLAQVLPPLLESGALPVRVAHNDAKGGNVLLDATSGEGLAVVDLDTVMPGTVLYDTGDLLRSLAAAAAEDETDLSRVRVEPDRVLAVARGFFAGCGAVVGPRERELFLFSGLLLAWEQGLRFLTDYLEGDRYYRCVRPGQNLDRCRVQFELVRQLEALRTALESELRRLAG